jgi:hypothetical protein
VIDNRTDAANSTDLEIAASRHVAYSSAPGFFLYRFTIASALM